MLRQGKRVEAVAYMRTSSAANVGEGTRACGRPSDTKAKELDAGLIP
jgi:hypothetical protein